MISFWLIDAWKDATHRCQPNHNELKSVMLTSIAEEAFGVWQWTMN